MRDVAVGVALTLSIVAFILALWPAVADAPWESVQIKEPIPIVEIKESVDPPEVCMRLAEMIANASTPDTTGSVIRASQTAPAFKLGQTAGCWD